jgi:hypothetical protein
VARKAPERPTTFGRRVRPAILLAAVACAVVLAACGGDDDGTTESTVSPATQKGSRQPGNGSGANGSKQTGGGSKQGEAANGGGSSSGDSGGGSGGGSSGEAQNPTGFKVPGGDNSIQEFGEEAPGSDLSQAQEAVAALFRAFRSSDWSEVCGQYLSRKTFETIKEVAKMSPVAKGTACPDVLAGLYSTGVTPEGPRNGVDAMRIKGKLGFALYRGNDGKGYAISLESEGGRWKLSALGPTPLEP